jgi:hypothetical protein
METEITTQQKISHFQKQLAEVLQLAEELSKVDTRFRVIRNSLKKAGRLIDPGAALKAELEKTAARMSPGTRAMKQSPLPLKGNTVAQAVPKTNKAVIAPEKKMPQKVKANPRSDKLANVPEPVPSSGSGFSTKKPSPKAAFYDGKKKTV